MEMQDNTDFDRGPFLTPQMVILFLFLVGAPLLFFLLGRTVPQDEPSLYGVYEGDESSQSEADRLPNRKADVDAAVRDVDFEKFDYQIELTTTVGKIRLDLWPDVAPGHCRNMIGLARIGFYEGIIFHRVIRGFMVQAGDPLATGFGGPGYTIPAEFNDRQHLPGVLSMARGNDPDSAGSQFFICTAARPDLDGKYTAFGQTADQESLDVVMELEQMETGENDRPFGDYVIYSAEVIPIPKSEK